MRLILIMFLSVNIYAENLNDLTLKLNHHGELNKVTDLKNNNIGFYVEDIKDMPQFGSQLLEDHFSRVSKIIPENTILILSASTAGTVTSISQSKKQPSLSLSHTDFESHSHPESFPISDISLNVSLNNNQNSIYLFVKSKNKLRPLSKVIIK
ncbi:MAG: hypothetical protein O3A43_06085 [Proteobacteria bacterium]|jgi:hypothetical protein|nr:hypothetical protein [Pseudomonadota bacterium]MDB2448449.1 hypothetical protein [Gammaproteobacteria bacterium]MDB2704737.1 hypothetical protein [Gammaproteobacteria bacterium]